jgi:Kef-type K+ transport system membrane component KefB
VKKVLIYSLLLVAGLVVSQILNGAGSLVISVLTMVALSFIMIHVGYEFEIDKATPRKYAWDYLVAATAAAFPWIFCAVYFVFAMAPRELWSAGDLWKEALLEARFSSPTSAGVLFSMLAAAGLGATWVFGKARILAIFDDLDTILLMIPLKIMIVGPRWQLAVIVLALFALLWIAWKYLHAVNIPITWPWVLGYSCAITLVSELIYFGSKTIDPSVPIHLEVLLPAFALGCIMRRPAGADPHVDDAREGHEEGPESESEQRVATIVSAVFMVLVGLSMPSFLPAADKPAEAPAETLLKYEGVSRELLAQRKEFPGWGMIAFHVMALTVLSNLGKMFPAFCYRKEASLRERIALSFGMFPRGEVGAGVLVVSISYGLGGPSVTAAILSLALNLLCTGLFIVVVKKLIAKPAERLPSPA